MARRKSDAQAPDSTEASAASAAPAKGRNNLIPAVVLAVGLAAAGYLFSSGGKSSSASAATAGPVAAAATTPTTLPEGETVKLDDTSLNLADSHYLKLGMSLVLKKGVKPEPYATKSAKARDIAITLYGGHTMPELNDPAGRERIKSQ